MVIRGYFFVHYLFIYLFIWTHYSQLATQAICEIRDVSTLNFFIKKVVFLIWVILTGILRAIVNKP